ncbi:MAG: hypothetical protein AAGK00_02775 [Pseudomonadota bacterium]
MYLRFVIPERDTETGVETGFFSGLLDIKYGETGAQQWIYDEVCRELTWFNTHLDAPRRLTRPGGRRGDVRGVCWFRPQAGEAISRARYCAWLLEEAGIATRVLRRAQPGEIIWCDDMQIVAKPARDHPRLFH